MSGELVSTTKMSLDTLGAEIREAHDLAERAARSTVEHAIRAGELLIEAKSRCAHGEWLPWLDANPAHARVPVRRVRLDSGYPTNDGRADRSLEQATPDRLEPAGGAVVTMSGVERATSTRRAARTAAARAAAVSPAASGAGGSLDAVLPCAGLDGPSRTIIVEPQEAPAEMPVPTPEETPAVEPEPAPEKEPVPA
jgi:hypothetical protein